MSSKVDDMKEALLAKGVRINVGGCGCCGSPWVMVEIDGEIVLDVDSISVYMIDEDGGDDE